LLYTQLTYCDPQFPQSVFGISSILSICCIYDVTLLSMAFLFVRCVYGRRYKGGRGSPTPDIFKGCNIHFRFYNKHILITVTFSMYCCFSKASIWEALRWKTMTTFQTHLHAQLEWPQKLESLSKCLPQQHKQKCKSVKKRFLWEE